MSYAVAIIPARGGSTRIPRKNIRDFHGKPIIAYSIETAEKSGMFRNIIVSTEDFEIASIANQYGAVVHIRKPEHARNEVGTQEVVRQTILDWGIEENEIVCCMYATAPLLDINDLKKGVKLLESSRDIDYAFSIGTNPLHDAGQFYFGRAKAFIESRPVFDSHTIMVPISEDRVCDINVEDDFLRAEAKYKKLRGESWTQHNSGKANKVTSITKEIKDS